MNLLEGTTTEPPPWRKKMSWKTRSVASTSKGMWSRSSMTIRDVRCSWRRWPPSPPTIRGAARPSPDKAPPKIRSAEEPLRSAPCRGRYATPTSRIVAPQVARARRPGHCSGRLICCPACRLRRWPDYSVLDPCGAMFRQGPWHLLSSGPALSSARSDGGREDYQNAATPPSVDLLGQKSVDQPA